MVSLRRPRCAANGGDADIVAVRQFLQLALCARRRVASFRCAVVRAGGRPMGFPWALARLRPSAVRVRIKVARRQRPSPSATVPPQTDHRPSTGGRGWCARGAAGPKCRHGTDRPAPGEIGPLAYRFQPGGGRRQCADNGHRPGVARTGQIDRAPRKIFRRLRTPDIRTQNLDKGSKDL
jgi:hypothetical protein